MILMELAFNPVAFPSEQCFFCKTAGCSPKDSFLLKIEPKGDGVGTPQFQRSKMREVHAVPRCGSCARLHKRNWISKSLVKSGLVVAAVVLGVIGGEAMIQVFAPEGPRVFAYGASFMVFGVISMWLWEEKLQSRFETGSILPEAAQVEYPPLAWKLSQSWERSGLPWPPSLTSILEAEYLNELGWEACWFCEWYPPDPQCASRVPMKMRLFAQQHEVSVPRCRACAAAHEAGKSLRVPKGLVGMDVTYRVRHPKVRTAVRDGSTFTTAEDSRAFPQSWL